MMKYHVRRKDKEITDEKVMKEILKTAQFVTIAMSKENLPYLVSLSHGYDESRNCVYFHCAKEGKKLDYLSSNNAVWGQALLNHGYLEGECSHLYATTHFSGRITLLEDLGDKRHALECMMRQLDSNPENMIEQLSDDRLSRTVIGKIDIDYMSGKKSEEVQI